jgi:outer membrane protein assembly factor BamB
MSLSRRAAALVSLSALAACSGARANDEDSMRRAGASSREEVTGTIESLKAAGRFKGEQWRLNLSERFGSAVHARSVAVDGNLLLVQDAQNRMHAIGRTDGVHAWVIDLPGPVTQTIGGTGSAVTFVCTDDLVTVDRRSGSRIDAGSNKPSVHLGFFPSGRAVAIGNSAYVGRLAPFSLQAVALGGGYHGWSFATKSPILDVVAYGDGAVAQVIGVTEDGILFSLPPRGAHESTWAPEANWVRQLNGARVVTPLVLMGDSLVFGCDNGFLYHVDARVGQVRWKTGCGVNQRGHEATIAGGSVYQHTDGSLMAFDLATGNPLWTIEGAKRVITRVGDRVSVDMGGEVAVVDAKSGKELARFGKQGLTLPTIQGGGQLIASDGANLFALE